VFSVNCSQIPSGIFWLVKGKSFKIRLNQGRRKRRLSIYADNIHFLAAVKTGFIDNQGPNIVGYLSIESKNASFMPFLQGFWGPQGYYFKIF